MLCRECHRAVHVASELAHEANGQASVDECPNGGDGRDGDAGPSDRPSDLSDFEETDDGDGDVQRDGSGP